MSSKGEASSLLASGGGGGTTSANIQQQHQPLPNQGFNLFLLSVSAIFVLSSFQFGYAIGVINTPQRAIQCQPAGSPVPDSPTGHHFFKECIPMTTTEWSIAVSIFAIGGLFGGLTGGTLADLLGRRPLVWLNNLTFLVAIGLMSLFSDFYVFSTGRFLIGLGSGITTVVVPMYLSEISPTALRGTIGVLPQLMTTIGIFVSQILSIFLSTRPVGWRVLLGWASVLPLVQAIMLPLCPESPSWLASRGKTIAASRALSMLRQSDDIEQEEQLLMQQSSGSSGSSGSGNKKRGGGGIKSLFQRELIRPLIIALVLQLAQQLCGVNAVFFYSTSIFQSAGVQNADAATAIVGVINVASTIVAFFLMDIAGRRLLLIVGQAGQFISFLVLTLSFVLQGYSPVVFGYISVVSVVGFVITFAIALGPIPWLILGELFPSSCRAYAMSIAVTVNWLSNFIVAVTFLPLTNALKQYTFFPFTGIILMTLVFTVLVVPETRGKTVEQITGISEHDTDDDEDKQRQQEEEEIHY